MAIYKNSEYLIETDWLEDNLELPNLRIFDCAAQPNPNADAERKLKYPLIPINAQEYYEKAHIPGAAYLDVPGNLTDITNDIPMMAPPISQATEYFSRMGIRDDSHVVLYSSTNFIWAARVWWLLKAVGFNNATILNGGLVKWISEKRCTSTSTSHYPPGCLNTVETPVFVKKEQVYSAIHDKDTLVIHALTPSVYDGSNDTLVFGRRGHIPSSINIASETLLDKTTNSYLSNDNLLKLFEEKQCDNKKRLITYCGGGVNASAVAFSLALIGYDNVSIYDGSMNEWGNEKSLPIEL